MIGTVAALKPAEILGGMLEPEARRAVVGYTKAQIRDAFGHDPWLCNYFVNLWECETGADVLESYPVDVSLPIADLCNARCTFCASWLTGSSFLKLEDVERYAEPLRFARTIGIQGHGEPLANPQIGAVLNRIGELIDPRTRSYIITNGIFLKRWFPELKRAKVARFNFSVNATTPEVHNRVMGLGPDGFDTAMAAVNLALAYRNEEDSSAEVTISTVINRDNIQQLADFIRMGNALGVDAIYLRSLLPIQHLQPGLNYHELPAILSPNFEAYVAEARAEMQRSKVRINAQPETWGQDAVPAALRTIIQKDPPPTISREDAQHDPRLRQSWRRSRSEASGRGERIGPIPDQNTDNPYNRSAPFPCRFVYRALISSATNFQIVPCCYITDVPGHNIVIFDGSRPFMDYWNSEAFVALRRSLRQGPLMAPCRRCQTQG